jgi:hypothetical protein
MHARAGGAALALVVSAAFAQVGPIAPEPARAQNATAAPDSAQVGRRLESVRTLVEGSSAARQIEASRNIEAAARRAEARSLVRLAEEAHAAHDERSAATLLDGAARQMLEGARLASGERAGGASLEREVRSRIEAAQALHAAQRRIAAEKSLAGAADSARQVEGLLARARALVAEQRFAEAQPVAQQAYFLAKASIGTMRGGDTLVRTLNFASKDEEYHYEVDRYETHRMLYELLAKRQPGDGAAGRESIARAADLRRQAEASAGRGDHAAAVGQLENATRELVRAIRAAGVFIPG